MKQSYSDKEIIKGLLTNDRIIFHWIYNNYCNKVIAIVVKNSGAAEEGKDVFQDTFLQVIDKIKKGNYKDENKFRAYFMGFANNVWRNRRKKKHRQITDSLDEKEYKLTDTSSEAISEMIRKEEELNKLHDVMMKIDEICRKILMLFYLKKEKLKDIAQQLNMTEGAVKVRSKRCKEKAFKMMMQ
jgi:RNA polymerase sigma-70 factor (ECF subfamily)